jgi:hypothetical protein
MYPDSIVISKKWNDKNGLNLLTIRVNALCNPNRPPFDGHITVIESSLKNDRHKLSIKYNEDDYQMKMIYFEEKDIWFYKYNGIQAVFIPFFYCSNIDSEGTVSYIILYDNKKYLYHFNFTCDNEFAFLDEKGGKCKLRTKNLNQKLKDLPNALRETLINFIKTHYKTTKDIFP